MTLSALKMSGCSDRKWIWEATSGRCYSTEWHRSNIWWYWSPGKCKRHIEGTSNAAFTKAWTLFQGELNQGLFQFFAFFLLHDFLLLLLAIDTHNNFYCIVCLRLFWGKMVFNTLFPDPGVATGLNKCFFLHLYEYLLWLSHFDSICATFLLALFVTNSQTLSCSYWYLCCE